MPTFTEVLPPTKSATHRALKYTPACAGVGVLELTDTKSYTRYALAVQPFGGVRLTKADGETYVVTAGQCECKGFLFSHGRGCRHLDAVHCLLANRWLEADDRETVRDIDAEAEERDAWYEDNSPDRLSDDEHADSLGRRIVCELGGC